MKKHVVAVGVLAVGLGFGLAHVQAALIGDAHAGPRKIPAAGGSPQSSPTSRSTRSAPTVAEASDQNKLLARATEAAATGTLCSCPDPSSHVAYVGELKLGTFGDGVSVVCYIPTFREDGRFKGSTACKDFILFR